MIAHLRPSFYFTIIQVLKDCERKHNSKDSKYETLADAINERVRDAVGESHWTQARKIQKQLAENQQKKKLKAMAMQRQKNQQKAQQQQQQQQQQQHKHNVSNDRLQELGRQDEAMEAARASLGFSST